MGNTLTPTMQHAVDYAKQHDGKLHRHPGGFWGAPSWWDEHRALFGTSTVAGLVRRGAAAYTEWKEGRNGRFPIVATLTPDTESDQQAP